MIQRFTLTIFLCISCNLLFSQGTAGIQLLSGANLSYVFNSIAKYKAGIIDLNRTVVGITVNDNGDPLYDEWTLDICFDDPDNDGFISGTVYNLPFSTVEISTSTVGCATCNVPIGLPIPYPLTDIPTTIREGGDGPGGADDIPPNLIFSADQIIISYFIGTNIGNNLLGSPPDFYTDDVVITLTVQ